MQTAGNVLLTDLDDTNSSGVTWSAIFAGAAGAAALSLILLVLGTGLGFSTISPWPNSGISATTLGVSTIVWLILTQILASGMGGYLAGRLRRKWTSVHTDEVFFRDTAHGFLTWAVSSLVVVALVGAVIGKTVSGLTSAGATAAATALSVTGATASEGMGKAESMQKYMVDSLFRPAKITDGNSNLNASSQIEAGRIIANGLYSSSLPQQDAQYLTQLVAKQTGLSQEEARRRVNETFARLQTAIATLEQNAKQAADAARKTAAYSALWMFIALLSGAFIASYAATFGGRLRDRLVSVKV